MSSVSPHAHRIQTLLAQVNDQPENDTFEFIQRLERNVTKMFQPLQQRMIRPQPCADVEVDSGEPSNQFVNLSRSLQQDKSMSGYNNFKQSSRSRTNSYAHGPRGESQAADTLFDPKVLLGTAAIGLALSMLPSSSPVPRSILSRTWPHLIQLALAYFIHVRKQQDVRSNLQRSHVVLYITSALIQFFTALRDFQGHTIASFTRRALLGPLDPLLVYMKDIIVALPSFLFKTVLLSGVSLLGKLTVITTIAVSVVVGLGLVIVLAAEKL